jgi:hypothetical protein
VQGGAKNVTYSKKVNVLVALLPAMLLVATVDTAEAHLVVRILHIAISGAIVVIVIAMALWCYNDCDRKADETRIVYRSLSVAGIMALQGGAMLFVPRTAPLRESIPLQSGSFRGFDTERRRSVVVMEVDGARMRFRAQDSFMSKLRQVEEGASVQFRAYGRQLTEVSSAGHDIVTYREFEQQYGTVGWRGAALVGVGILAYLWFTTGRERCSTSR